MVAGHEFEFGVCLSCTFHVHTTFWRQDKIMGRFDTLIGICVLLTLGVCLFMSLIFVYFFNVVASYGRLILWRGFWMVVALHAFFYLFG